MHRALPELDYAAIDTAQRFLRARLRLPLLISCMTGGSGRGRSANRALAEAAQRAGVAVGVGSIRPLLRDPDTFADFHVKPHAPDVPVLANLGAVQLRDLGAAALRPLLERLEVQGLVVHLNAGQELFQPGGDRDFRGLLEAIAGAVAAVGCRCWSRRPGSASARRRSGCCWDTGCATWTWPARAAPTGLRWRGNGWRPRSGGARARSPTGGCRPGCCWRRWAGTRRAA